MVSDVSGSIGRWIIRVSRAAQRRVLGLRVPICKAREAGIEKRLLVADRRLAEASDAVNYWRAEVARIEDEVDQAWRLSLRVAEKVDLRARQPAAPTALEDPWLS